MPMLAEQLSSNWKAHLHLSLQHRVDKTRLVPLKRFGPLTVQRPFYPEDETCHVYLLHPPGGIVGGDELNLKIEAQPNSHALITTPGATKFYRSAGQTALFNQSLQIDKNARLEFLPLENIYFPGAIVKAQTDIHLKQNSECIFWESHCFGRPANKEPFDTGNIILKLNVFEQKKLLVTDRQLINAIELQRSCGVKGNAVVSQMVIISSNINNDLITALRQVSAPSGDSGISQLDERVLMIRVMSNSTLDNANYLQALWAIARPMTLQKAPCPPRIWQT